MRLLPCHKGHRFRLPHWPLGAYVDILYVGQTTLVTRDETGRDVMIDRDDLKADWIHLGVSPTHLADGRRKKPR